MKQICNIFSDCSHSTKKTTLSKKFLVCFSLAVLLGLSWSLGYLVLVLKHHAHHVLSIIFCICQTTQV